MQIRAAKIKDVQVIHRLINHYAEVDRMLYASVSAIYERLQTFTVAEDDNGKRRLRRVARACQNYGQRVQYSVFECLVNPAEWAKLKSQLMSEIDPKYDSLRFYHLGANWQRRVEHIGAKVPYDAEGTIIV